MRDAPTSPLLLPRRWIAIRDEGSVGVGISGARRMQCALCDDDRIRAPFVVKAPNEQCVPAWLWADALGSVLAGAFALPVPEPGLVELDPDIVGREPVARRCWGFGSMLLPTLEPILRDQPLPRSAWQSAIRLLVFDAFAEHNDRKPTNPNCGTDNGQLVPYDFGLCFGYASPLAVGPNEWERRAQEVASNHIAKQCAKRDGQSLSASLDVLATLLWPVYNDLQCLGVPDRHDALVRDRLREIQGRFTTFRNAVAMGVAAP